jgi:hypothetical protein
VKKADVLREFPTSIAGAPEAKSSDSLPQMQIDILEIARKLWPTGKMPPRVKERNKAIQSHFGKNPPCERTIRRAFNSLN